MITTVIEEMVGSNHVLARNDCKRAFGWKSKTFNESEMALFLECRQQCPNYQLDSADIVREGDLSPMRGGQCSQVTLQGQVGHPASAVLH